jgi:hypothetical protein
MPAGGARIERLVTSGIFALAEAKVIDELLTRDR